MSLALLAVISIATLQSRGEMKTAPMPAWVDALDLSENRSYVNERLGVESKASKPRPRFQVGDLTRAIPEDARLVPGDVKSPIRPIGTKDVGLDDLMAFGVSRNGFNRRLGWSPKNEVTFYELAYSPKPGEGKIFIGWFEKFNRMFGKPTFVFRDEFATERQERIYSSQERPSVYFNWGIGSELIVCWVWGRSSPTTQFGERDYEANTRPMYTISLIYSAPTTVYRNATDRRGERHEARVVMMLNPYGIAAG